MLISGNFLRSPNNARRHSCLISAHPAPRNLGAYARRGDTHLSLVVGFNRGDNPFSQTHYRFDIRRIPDRPRLLNTIELARCKKLKIVGWVFLDDSPLGMSKRRVVVDQVAQHVKCDAYIVALEADEYLSFAQHMELGQRLRDKLGPKAKIYQHLTTDQWSHRNNPDDWGSVADWCTGMALQVKTDVLPKLAQYRSNIHAVRPDVEILYGEGSTDWSNQECNAMAQAAYDAGLVSGSLHGLIRHP